MILLSHNVIWLTIPDTSYLFIFKIQFSAVICVNNKCILISEYMYKVLIFNWGLYDDLVSSGNAMCCLNWISLDKSIVLWWPGAVDECFSSSHLVLERHHITAAASICIVDKHCVDLLAPGGIQLCLHYGLHTSQQPWKSVMLFWSVSCFNSLVWYFFLGAIWKLDHI